MRRPPLHPAVLPALAPLDCNAIATAHVRKLCRSPWRTNPTRPFIRPRTGFPSVRHGRDLPDGNGRWQVCPTRMGLYRPAGLAVTTSSIPVKPGIPVRLHEVATGLDGRGGTMVWSNWPGCSVTTHVDRDSTSIYAVVHNGNPTSTPTLAKALSPQESPPRRASPVTGRATATKPTSVALRVPSDSAAQTWRHASATST